MKRSEERIKIIESIMSRSKNKGQLRGIWAYEIELLTLKKNRNGEV